jgi:hypothetical protein
VRVGAFDAELRRQTAPGADGAAGRTQPP